MRNNRTDQNTKIIVEALRKAGAVWIDMTGAPNVGFDGAACKAGRIYFVEIKNGSRPPSARRLTDNEMRRSCELSRVGVTVHIVSDVTQALRLIGALR